jgi:hypothetical protein
MAFSGLLVFDFTVFILTITRSFRLWNRREPFLHRLFIDGAFMTYSYHLTSQNYDFVQAFSIMGTH